MAQPPRGSTTIRRFGSSPMDCVETSGLPLSARWIQRRSSAGIGSSWSILPVSTTRVAARSAISRSCRSLGDLAELALATAAVVLDVHEDSCPRAHLPGEHQVHEVLERREALALAPDQGTELLALTLGAEDVEPARLAGLDLDARRVPDVGQELLEDHLAGGERLGRGLGGLELGSFGGNGAAGCRDLGLLAGGQVGAAPTRRPLLATGTAIEGTLLATGTAIVANAGFGVLALRGGGLGSGDHGVFVPTRHVISTW